MEVREAMNPLGSRLVGRLVLGVIVCLVTLQMVLDHQRYRTTEIELQQIRERSYAIAVEVAQLKELLGQQKNLGSEAKLIGEALRFLRTPTLGGIHLAFWEGRRVKVIDFDLKGPVDPRNLQAASVPEGWRPETTNIEANLPYHWPRSYLETFNQPFYPDAVLMNFAALANWVKAGGAAEAIQPYVEFLVQRTRQYLTATQEGGQLVTYRFDYPWHDQTFRSGWVSPYGNASVLAGMLYFIRAVPNERLLLFAQELFNGLRMLDGRDKLWVTFIDPEQYVWFEEYPLEGRKAHVINGHIWTTLVVAEYCLVTKRDDVCSLARAGLTTAKRYILDYRSPGRINRYDLYVPYNADYDPERTVRYQEALFALTGDPFFDQMAKAFATDMPLTSPPSPMGR
ncbi:D-glucuronyl C5-epimerase family protein [Bradyrhizobium sp. I1.7.5]|uniref:D-glucuronyl C5-epimerase family protein n=1 Tax=Bradyrhizobium sp. I1.7.5 TaxID=3156363 RepID=UPI003396E203